MQRAVQHLKGRFEFALSQRKPLHISQKDLEALNLIIRHSNGERQNKGLEDALLLLPILSLWKIENEENRGLKINQRGINNPAKITQPEIILEKLSNSINPKEKIIEEIRDELRIHQAMNGTPKEKRIKTKEVADLLEKVLERAKTNFPLIKELADDRRD